MKAILKKASLVLTGILVGGKLFAQTTDTMHTPDYVKPFSGNSSYSTWSVGVGVGILSTSTIFTSNSRLDFTSPNSNFGYSAYVKNQITPAIGIQADFLAGKLTGNNSQVNPAIGNAPFSSFSTQIHYSGSLSANITFGNISWHANKNAIQPYLTVGFGAMNYTPVVTYTDGTVTNFKTNGGNNGAIGEVFTPVGVGLKFDIAPNVNLDLGYQVNFVYSDNIDGYNLGPGNDKFSYLHAGLEFALGGSHSKPQLATHNPVSSMRHEYMWENEHTKTELQTQIDAQKAQIEAERERSEKLRNDLNATNAALARFTMDSDNDGVPDFLDKCPNTPPGTKVDGSGCPLPVNNPDVKVYVTEEDKRIVNEAVKNLEFDFNKTTIRQHSLASLDRLAKLLIDKHFNLKLAGYTDNVGSVAFNLRLSKGRAEAVKNYLVSKGEDASRIEAVGYGKAHPIASNKTASGRQLNRRVEFSLY